MARKPIPLRLDEKQLDRLAAIAVKLQVSKTSIIEAALDVRLDLLEGYVKLDTAPPKTVPLALARKVKGGTLKPGGVTHVDGFSDAAVITGRRKAEAKAKPSAPARSVRGYAIDGSPIYR